MALTIDATAGSASANSYVTEVEQIAYMATRLNASAWSTMSGTTCTETEKQAMIEAARALTPLAWRGARATLTQALSWPRWSAPNPDSPTGWDYLTTDIPQRVRDAAAELAFQFLKAGATDIAALDPSVGVIRKKIDVLETEWQPYQRPTGLAQFPSVLRTIMPLLAGAGNVSELVRG